MLEARRRRPRIPRRAVACELDQVRGGGRAERDVVRGQDAGAAAHERERAVLVLVRLGAQAPVEEVAADGAVDGAVDGAEDVVQD